MEQNLRWHESAAIKDALVHVSFVSLGPQLPVLHHIPLAMLQASVQGAFWELYAASFMEPRIPVQRPVPQSRSQVDATELLEHRQTRLDCHEG
jgi:hypothetical protein